MGTWRLIALDMDGTLLDTNMTISPENRRWLLQAREQGVEFTFATGRMRQGIVQRYAEDLQIRVPIVTLNGSAVWTADGTLLEAHTLRPELTAFLYQVAREYASQFWVCTLDQVFDQDSFAAVQDRFRFAKFGFVAQDATTIRMIWRQLEEHGDLEITNTHPLNIEVNPLGVSKAAGLQIVCQEMGIQPREVVTMGDSLNDISMLRWSGLGIAMGNAQDIVKEVADDVTSSHTEHGVARAIERLLHAAL